MHRSATGKQDSRQWWWMSGSVLVRRAVRACGTPANPLGVRRREVAMPGERALNFLCSTPLLGEFERDSLSSYAPDSPVEGSSGSGLTGYQWRRFRHRSPGRCSSSLLQAVDDLQCTEPGQNEL